MDLAGDALASARVMSIWVKWRNAQTTRLRLDGRSGALKKAPCLLVNCVLVTLLLDTLARAIGFRAAQWRYWQQLPRFSF